MKGKDGIATLTKVIHIIVNAHHANAKTLIWIGNGGNDLLLVMEHDICHDESNQDISERELLEGRQFHDSAHKRVNHFVIVENTTAAATEQAANPPLCSLRRDEEYSTNDGQHELHTV